MNFGPTKRYAIIAVAVGLAVAVVAGAAYLALGRRNRLPAPDSATYEETVRSFYRGLASLQVGLLDAAQREFTRATELVEGEPAAWANLGLTRLRLGDYEAAAGPIERAAALAPTSSEVAFLRGRMESSRGHLDQGIAHLRSAVELDRRNLRARFALAQEIERGGGQGADAQVQALVDELIELRPRNLAARLERIRLAARRADGRSLRDSVGRLDALASAWPPVAVEQYRALQQAAEALNFQDAVRAAAFLRNVLVRTPAFLESLAEISVASELIADPFERFLKLPPPSAGPAPRDEALTFALEPLAAATSTPAPSAAGVLLAFSPTGSDAPAIVAADGDTVRWIGQPNREWPFPGGTPAAPPTANGILALDWNGDFKLDLVTAGRGGIRLLTQYGDGTFTDTTAEAATHAPVDADCFGVWAADVDMDGDLDVVVGVRDAAPVVLRNNGDGTWRPVHPFAGVSGVRAFVWADVDGDGDPDAALLDASGELHVFANRQGGQLQPAAGPGGLGRVIALAVGDANADGALDLVTLDRTGSVRRASMSRAGGRIRSDAPTWDQERLAAWPDVPAGASAGEYRLFLADLDNNGAIDVAASGSGRSRVWLAGDDDLQPLAALPASEIFGVVDLNGDGQLDLVGIADAQPVRLIGHGTKGYHWQVVRPRAQPVAGDQRINSFGIGGEIEIRSGLLTQKQVLTTTVAHFGLGARTGLDVVRLFWPNGIVQADFDARADQAVVAEQRLKGSCPWVFTYDGTGMRFVTDFLWRSPLGLRINAQDTAGITQTEDWVRIGGDQLVPRDGSYDVRITAELWETHFVDHVSLMAVDHPDDVEVYVDERFAPQAPSLTTHATTQPRGVTRAWDEAGRDVAPLVARQDGRYLATFERGRFQGVAQDHFVEFELDEEIPSGRRRWLVANGWIYPTDSSINVAIAQGRHVQPRGVSLEAQDPHGRWVVVASDLGFPAGKNKTMLIDLGDLTRAGAPRARRLRLRTNLEIYWDWLAVADAVDTSPLVTKRLNPDRAELRYRGFSQTDHARRDVPEVPTYAKIANVAQRWRDLIGYYTRFGSVGELVARVDDRYVIMNAGDELRLSFPVPPPPPAGWTRDFVLIGDGWVKDGDFNTGSSKTVHPLPSHGQRDYPAVSEAREIEDDPVYRRHPRDWQTYHTRFVTPRDFLAGLTLRSPSASDEGGP